MLRFSHFFIAKAHLRFLKIFFREGEGLRLPPCPCVGLCIVKHIHIGQGSILKLYLILNAIHHHIT